MTDTLSRNLTLEDVARLSGVSRSTVSRVINNHPNVSSHIRERVLQVVEQTGYHPNEAARMLASQRSWMIGLVLPHSVRALFSDPYFSNLIQGIAQGCNLKHYTMSLFLISSKEDEDNIFPRISRNGLLDGVIIQAGEIGDQLAERLQKSGVPLVIAGRPFHPDRVTYIDSDNIFAAQTAVSHLIRLGRKRIGTVTGPTTLTVGLDRIEGYKQALLESGRDVDETLIVEGDFTEKGGYYAMKSLLHSRPDAVFVASDTMAMGAIQAIEEQGLEIPKDISLVGFDDLHQASNKHVQLTTIRQPVIPFGLRAVDVLDEIIETGVSKPKRIILDTELVIRKTCGAYQM